MNNPILIRVDGSTEIGMGHFMRCISLAEELSRRGLKPVFCIRPIEAALINEILKKGFEVSEIPVAATPEEDVQCLIYAVQKYKSRTVVLDGYNFDAYYIKRIRKGIGLLLSIDDIAETFYCSDVVLNQNINATEKMYDRKISKNTKLLLGPAYALLRPEFKRLHILEKNCDKVNNILVTFGGADLYNQTLKVLKALKDVGADFSVTVVSGISNVNKESIRDYAASGRRKVEILDNVRNMAELMLKADIAISSAGTTSWELCCLGLPALQIVLAKNQDGSAKELGKKGITINLGWHENVTESDITAAVTKLIDNVDKRRVMSSNGKSIVDGKGAERVASEMCTFMDKN